MSFVQGDHMVEDFSSAASDPAFRNSVLPRCLDACTFRFDARCLQECDHLVIEFRVVVQDGVAVRTSFWERFAQLLHDPIGCRMASDVEMQDSASSMLDDEKAIEELETQHRNGEKVEGDDHLAVIGEKREPALAGIAAAPYAL